MSRLTRVAAFAVAIACPPTYLGSAIIMGLALAQASLLGLWIGLGASPVSFRVITTFFGFAWLGLAMSVKPGFGGEGLVFQATVLTVVAGSIFWTIRRYTGRVLAKSNGSEEALPFQFRIRHLLLLTLMVALVLGAVRLTEDSEVEMVVYVFLIAAGFGSMPVAVCWAVFGRGTLKWRTLAVTMFFLLVASTLSLTAYSQTGNDTVALHWLLLSVIEAAVLAVSLWFLYRFGYRIAAFP